MKKLLSLLCIIVSCKEFKKQEVKAQDVDWKTMYKNLKQYLTVQIKDAATIDSLSFYIDSVTPRKKMHLQAGEYSVTGNSWQNYEPSILSKTYPKEYLIQQYTKMYAISDSLIKKTLTEDSTTLLLWGVTFKGLFTKTDVTQQEFMGDIFMTPQSYKIVKKSDVLIFPEQAIYLNRDDIHSYPYTPNKTKEEMFDSR